MYHYKKQGNGWRTNTSTKDEKDIWKSIADVSTNIGKIASKKHWPTWATTTSTNPKRRHMTYQREKDVTKKLTPTWVRHIDIANTDVAWAKSLSPASWPCVGEGVLCWRSLCVSKTLIFLIIYLIILLSLLLNIVLGFPFGKKRDVQQVIKFQILH